MPKFEIQKILRPIELGEYAPEYEGGRILVWVNIPQGLMAKHDAAHTVLRELVARRKKDEISIEDAQKLLDASNESFLEVLQEIWSQGPEETRFTLDEVREMRDGLLEQDPQMWNWIIREMDDRIREHRTGLKKALTPP